jgi:hypothetical protein
VLIFATAYNIAVCSARGGRTLKMANKSYSHLVCADEIAHSRSLSTSDYLLRNISPIMGSYVVSSAKRQSLSFAYNLNFYTIMSKQKKIVEVPVTSEEERQELSMRRMTFAALLMMICQGGQAEVVNFLSDKTADEVREYAEIWDKCATDPVGAVFQRPAFELLANMKDMVNEGGAAK